MTLRRVCPSVSMSCPLFHPSHTTTLVASTPNASKFPFLCPLVPTFPSLAAAPVSPLPLQQPPRCDIFKYNWGLGHPWRATRRGHRAASALRRRLREQGGRAPRWKGEPGGARSRGGPGRTGRVPSCGDGGEGGGSSGAAPASARLASAPGPPRSRGAVAASGGPRESAATGPWAL